MNNDKKYLSVKDFAKAAGVSRQTIYNRLDKDLTEFVKEFDRMKFIDEAALRIFVSKESVKFDSQIDIEFEKEQSNFDTDLTENLTAFDTKIIEMLQHNLEILQKQLNEKDRQIAGYEEQLKEKDKQIADWKEQLKIAQELHAGTIQKQLIVQSEGEPAVNQSTGLNPTSRKRKSFRERLGELIARKK